MNKLTLVLVLCAVPALAQITVTPGEPSSPATESAQPARQDVENPPVRRAVPVKSATPAPKVTPAPQKKPGGFFGFFRRIFGSSETQKPTAKPTATPKAKPSPTAKPAASPKVTPAQPKPTAMPTAATPAPTASPKQAPRKSNTTPVPAPINEGVTDTPIPTGGNYENAQYQKIKQQALKDSTVAGLQEKMLTTLSEHPEGGEAYKAAATEYTTALFDKMRKLDPANAEQITRREGATKRRINAGLPIVQ